MTIRLPKGIDVEDVNGEIRIIATTAVTINLDDVDSIKDARNKATFEGKSIVSMKDVIKSRIKMFQQGNEHASCQTAFQLGCHSGRFGPCR
jgi:hypothetical protein